jgi:hypothetical protein
VLSELFDLFENSGTVRVKLVGKLLKGQSYKKGDELRVWGVSLGLN